MFHRITDCTHLPWQRKLECHNTVFGSKRSAIYAQAVYFLHSTMPSVTCLRLNDASVIYRFIYFHFWIQPALLPCRQPSSTAAYVVYPISDIGRCRKLGLGELFWIDSNGKMETKYTVEGSKFPVVCNHCVVWRVEVAIRWNVVRNVCV